MERTVTFKFAVQKVMTRGAHWRTEAENVLWATTTLTEGQMGEVLHKLQYQACAWKKAREIENHK